MLFHSLVTTQWGTLTDVHGFDINAVWASWMCKVFRVFLVPELIVRYIYGTLYTYIFSFKSSSWRHFSCSSMAKTDCYLTTTTSSSSSSQYYYLIVLQYFSLNIILPSNKLIFKKTFTVQRCFLAINIAIQVY